MAVSNSEGDLILSLNLNTKKASESITDLVRQIKTAVNSFKGNKVQSAQLQTLEIQARQAIERINELRQRIQSMQEVRPTDEWVTFRQRVSEVGAEIERLEQKQQEFIDNGREGSTEYVQLRQALEDARKEEARLAQQARELVSSGRDVTSEAEQQPQAYERANNQLRQEEINLSRINANIQRLTSNTRTSTNRISQFFRNMANNATKSYGKVRKESRKTSREANKGFGQLGRTFKLSLKTLIKYGLGMRSFFFLFRKVRSAIIDSLKELAGYSDDVNKTLSNTKSAATKLKNSIATAIQPIVSVLAPVLTNVANNLSSVMNSVAQFFAALTGQSVVYQALDVQEDYADSLDETAKNADNATKALEKYLSPLDDLNRYTDNKSKDSTDTTDVSPVKFTTTKVDNQFKTVADKVKKYFKDIFKPIKSAWDKYGQGVITSWHTMLKNIKGAIKDIAIAFKNVWTNGTGEKVVGNILILWKDILDIINAVTQSFRKAFNKNSLGEQVIQSILDNFSNLLELIHSVARDFRAIWEDGAGERIWTNILTIVRNINRIIGGFWSRLKKAWDQNETGKKIWKEILGFIEDVSGWISEMSGIIAGWVEKLDFSPLLESLPKLISGFRRLWKVLSQKLKGVFENVLLPLAKWTIEEGLPKLIEAFADALEWLSDVLDAIPQYVWDGIAGGILAIVGAVIAGKVVYGICTTIVKGLSLLTAHPLMTALAITAGVIVGIVTAVNSYNSTEWNNSSLKKETDKINEYSTKLQEAADNIDNAVDTANKNVIEVGVDISRVENLKNRLKEIISDGLITKDEFPEYQVIKDSLKDLDGFEESWAKLDLSEDKEGNIHINDNIDDVSKRLDDLFKKWQLANAYEALSSTSKTAYTTKETNAIDLKNARDNVEKSFQAVVNDLISSGKHDTTFEEYRRWYGNLSDEEITKRMIESWRSGTGFYGFSDKQKALIETYENAKKSLENYSTAQSNAETLYKNSTDAMRFLKGETDNYAGALYAVESGLIDAETAYEQLGWNYEDNTVKLERLASRQRDADTKTTTNAEQSSSRQQSASNNTTTNAEQNAEKQAGSQSKIREEQNKTTVNAKQNAEKQKKASEGTVDATKTAAQRTAEIILGIGESTAKGLSYDKGKTIGNSFMSGINDGIQGTKKNFWTTLTESLGIGFKDGTVTFGGRTFKVGNIPPLASGAVIPAGKPFMAMLGDQTRGKNLEAPEGLIRQIFREETSKNNTGNKTYNIPVQIGSKTLFTIVLDEAKLQRMQTGYNPFVKLGG